MKMRDYASRSRPPARCICASVAACLVALGITARPTQSWADDAPATARVRGQVRGIDDVPLAGVTVYAEGPTLAGPRQTTTAADGTFRFDDLPAPGVVVIAAAVVERLDPTSGRQSVELQPGRTTEVTLVVTLRLSEQVTVTDTGEQRLRRETPASVETLDREAIDTVRPTHPGQLLAQVPGVWVNTTGGEGHMTAIRQPLTTNPVYLYLEDGVPTRSTGFFNHNALYETNVPAAGGVEVTRGPGSALYGSDAIGGVVNVLTRSGFDQPGVTVDTEGGGWGWARVLAGAGVAASGQALRADANLTRTDGWRDATGYDRQSGSVRWDRVLGGASSLKTLATFTRVDQQTAGSSTLAYDDYLDHPRLNLTPISVREVEAFRLSTEYQRALGPTLVSVLPYFRYNSMRLLPNWSLTYDPVDYTTKNTSYGLVARVRRDFTPMRAQIVGGLDVDVSPGSRLENSINPVSERDEEGRRFFVDYTPGPVIYDYDVRFSGVSPFLHAELSPHAKVRLSAGLRADFLGYAYDDRLTTPETPRYLRPADTTRRYDHLSPKLGATWAVSDAVSLFGNYRHAFRAPSEGQLFRQGATLNTIDLRPVKADNLEAGVRATPSRYVSFDASFYRLVKRDDILSYRDPVDGYTETRNAGRTTHQGLEVSAEVTPHPFVRVHAAWTWARHEYEDWQIDPGLSYDGNEMEAAPDQVGDILVQLAPGRKVTGSLELVRVGEYWLDAANTHTYDGHTLLNLRAEWTVARHVQIYGRLLNATDARYAETGGFTLARGVELAPGMPRTLYGGLRLEWHR